MTKLPNQQHTISKFFSEVKLVLDLIFIIFCFGGLAGFQVSYVTIKAQNSAQQLLLQPSATSHQLLLSYLLSFSGFSFLILIANHTQVILVPFFKYIYIYIYYNLIIGRGAIEPWTATLETLRTVSRIIKFLVVPKICTMLPLGP